MTTLVTAEDGSLPGNTYEEKLKILTEWNQYNLDKYYDIIEPFTFKTIFVPISRKDAELLQLFNRGKLEDKQEFNKNIVEPLSAAISKFPQGAFVRLSTRSPKDAVDKVLKFTTLLSKYIDNAQTLNDRYIGVKRCFFEVMKCNNATQALELISYSARSISDIKRALEYTDNDLNFVVREFKEFNPLFEFRGFVKDKKLVAVTQYDKTSFHPAIAFGKDSIAQQIQTFYTTKIRDILPFGQCIIDFALSKNNTYVVELNPYGTSTGCGLFDWEKDIRVLSGELPFEIRVVEKPLQDEYLEAYLRPWEKPIETILKHQQRKRSMNTIIAVSLVAVLIGLKMFLN
jgi:hypothetical protein